MELQSGWKKVKTKQNKKKQLDQFHLCQRQPKLQRGSCQERRPKQRTKTTNCREGGHRVGGIPDNNILQKE